MVEIGSTARGKCSARVSARLPVIARAPDITETLQKPKTKMPTDRNPMKLWTPRFVDSSTPKTR